MVNVKQIMMSIVFFLIVILMGIAYFSPKEVNYAKFADTTNFDNEKIANDMVIVDYASDEKVIFHYSFGLFVFDLKDKTIYRSIDLSSIDANYINGSTLTEVDVSPNGETVYIYNTGDTIDKSMFKYDINKNFLTRLVRKDITDKYIVEITHDNPPAGYASNEGSYSPTMGRINENTVAYIFSDNLTAKDLQLIIYDEATQNKESYNLFK